MKILTKEEQNKADEDFRYYCDIYYSSSNEIECEQAWQKMFDLVYNASTSAVKMKLKGVKVFDIDNIICETACNVMKMIKKKKDKREVFVLKNRLVTLCGPYSLYPLYSKQQAFEDRCISLNAYIEDNGEYADWKEIGKEFD